MHTIVFAATALTGGSVLAHTHPHTPPDSDMPTVFHHDGLHLGKDGLFIPGAGPSDLDVAYADAHILSGESFQANQRLRALANMECARYENPCDCSLADPVTMRDVDDGEREVTVTCGWSSSTTNTYHLGMCRAGSTTYTDEMLNFAAGLLVEGGIHAPAQALGRDAGKRRYGGDNFKSIWSKGTFKECLRNLGTEVTPEHVERVMVLIAQLDAESGADEVTLNVNTREYDAGVGYLNEI